ncbi:MAG: hypothetical protein NWE89_15295 [Candidatus Bathyarchaeota archaeon]|nr:hypothetical protein [Candidatus Bathyarchaeota archaeon]
MSNRKVGALISALITLVIFVGIPYMLPDYLEPETMEMAAEYGFDLPSLFNQMMIIGAVTAGLTLIKGFVDETSGIFLLVAIAQNVSTLAFTVVLLGAGNVMNLGLTSFTINQGGVVSQITMDLRVFIYLTFLTVGLKVVQVYLEWNETRKAAAPPGRIPA